MIAQTDHLPYLVKIRALTDDDDNDEMDDSPPIATPGNAILSCFSRIFGLQPLVGMLVGGGVYDR